MSTRSNAAIVGAFLAAGCAALSKEIAVLVVPILLYAIWCEGRWRALDRADHALGGGGLSAARAAVPVDPPDQPVEATPRRSSCGSSPRAPNHGREWFVRVLFQYVTPPVLVLIVVGAVAMISRRRADDRVVLAYVVLFLVFFTAWPTKLFPYLYLLIPAMCAIAAVGLVTATRRIAVVMHNRRLPRLLAGLVLAATLAFLATLSWRAVTTTAAKDIPGMADFDVEVQSFAGTREFAEWARSTPTNARFLTIGPSLGNILRFYGERDSVAMSVSVDPTKRNPAYVPIPNPDSSLRELRCSTSCGTRTPPTGRASTAPARSRTRASSAVRSCSPRTWTAPVICRWSTGRAPEGIRARLVGLLHRRRPVAGREH